jgi:uncharacterized protein (TIGR02421 family)
MTSLNSESEKERIRTVAQLLQQAAKPVRILKTIGWDLQIKADFFANNAQQLPQVTYPKFDPNPTLEILREARRNIFPQSSRVDMWLERQSNCIEWGAQMLANVGNPAFLVYGRQAYGDPTTPLRYDPKTPLQLAQSIRDSIEKLDHIKMNIPSPAIHLAEEVAEQITKAVQEHFGEDAPEVVIVDQLSANALATSKQIRIRRDAKFTDKDAIQLINHEAFIHVLTSVNGKKQTDLPILGEGHVGTTRTQEGLAVFAEVISGTMELNRFQRLADRVFAIQMAIEGADFIQVYRYFLEPTDQPEQAFESTRRVFRGGVVSGGVPFTKDVVYLFGLLQVSAVIRAAFSAGRADCLRLLFCGKLDTSDIPALGELTALGLCKLPTYLPPWILDPRYLLALLTYSNFISQLDLQTATEVVQRFLADTPVIEV